MYWHMCDAMRLVVEVQPELLLQHISLAAGGRTNRRVDVVAVTVDRVAETAAVRAVRDEAELTEAAVAVPTEAVVARAAAGAVEPATGSAAASVVVLHLRAAAPPPQVFEHPL